MPTIELVKTIEDRIEALKAEGKRMAENAANAAYEPYRVAIEENRRVLALLEASQATAPDKVDSP